MQRHALVGGEFAAQLAADPDVRRYLTPEKIANLFDMNHHLRHIETLFTRALGDVPPGGDDGSA